MRTLEEEDKKEYREEEEIKRKTRRQSRIMRNRRMRMIRSSVITLRLIRQVMSYDDNVYTYLYISMSYIYITYI